MSAQQLALRILAQEAKVPSDRIRRGAISHKEFLELEEKSKQLFEIPLFIDDTPALNLAGLRTRARRLCRQEKIGLIIIDYLQLLSSGNRGYDNRVQELTEITRGLKALAKELDLPIIALSQLSRAVEQREDKQPQLADLRESGSIEQDADVVMFVYREAYYEARKKPPAGSEKMQEWQAKMAQFYNVADLIISKQRHGPIGTIHLHFEENFMKFSNLNL
jgi:replicative DNA helicase